MIQRLILLIVIVWLGNSTPSEARFRWWKTRLPGYRLEQLTQIGETGYKRMAFAHPSDPGRVIVGLGDVGDVTQSLAWREMPMRQQYHALYSDSYRHYKSLNRMGMRTPEIYGTTKIANSAEAIARGEQPFIAAVEVQRIDYTLRQAILPFTPNEQAFFSNLTPIDLNPAQWQSLRREIARGVKSFRKGKRLPDDVNPGNIGFNILPDNQVEVFWFDPIINRFTNDPYELQQLIQGLQAIPHPATGVARRFRAATRSTSSADAQFLRDLGL